MYQYSALHIDSIRLLTVQRQPDDSLTASLKPTRLKSGFLARRPSYFALSYSWGQDTQTHLLTCDGRQLPIRTNLRDALHHLEPILNGSPIWVDAVCINQNDEVEKYHQLQKMPQIYKGAQRVLIWLGHESDLIRYTVERLPNLIAQFRSLTREKAVTFVPDPRVIDGIRDLFTRSWWSRLWVLQEAGLARHAIFVCGSLRIEWKTLRDVARGIRKLRLSHIFCETRPSSLLQSCDGFSELLNIEIIKHQHSTTLVSNMLRVSRQRDCYDPRDRINALMGVLPSHFYEDYTWDPKEDISSLYSQFAAIMVQYDINGVTLSLIETEPRRAGLPSWVPDFHQRGPADLLADHEGYHAGFNIDTGSIVKFDPKNWSQIMLPSIEVDRVSKVVEECWIDIVSLRDSDDVASASQRNLNWLNLCLEAHKADGFATPVEDLWRIFIGDQLLEEDSQLHWLAGFGKFHDSLSKRKSIPQEVMFTGAYQKLPTLLQDLASKKPASGQGVDLLPSYESAEHTYLRKITPVCGHRRFFVTAQGRVGLGPLAIQEDDLIAICKGFKVPFVQRQVKSPMSPSTSSSQTQTGNQSTSSQVAYNLIGEAYVHGLMRGQGIQKGCEFRDRLIT